MDPHWASGFWAWIIIVVGYAVTMLLSGRLVSWVIGVGPPAPTKSSAAGGNDEVETAGKQRDIGAIIGKCENFLTVTLILVNEVTGLALIFAAKSIVRAEDMKNNPRYYLGGTLVNFCFSVFMGFAIRILLGLFFEPGHAVPECLFVSL